MVGSGNPSEYALAVQKEAREAAESVPARSMVKSGTWASPLATAPSAVCTMAVLLRTAASAAAAGVAVKSRDVKGDRGEIIGELPHELLYANPEPCSNLGRNAFTDARSTMSYINKVAIKMIENKGKLESILRAIDEVDDDDEDDNDGATLVDDVNDVRESTAGCLAKIKDLTRSFQYWYRMIQCLKENVAACQEKEANVNGDSLQKNAAEKKKLAEKDKSTSETIEKLQQQLKDAEKRVSEASAYMKELESVVPVITEPSLEEKHLSVEKKIIQLEKKKGLLGRAKEFIKGESTKDFMARTEHQRDTEQRRDEIIERERKQRESQKEEARRALAEARAHEKDLSDKVTQLIADIGRNKEKLASAMASLDSAEPQFKRLEEEKLDLNGILAILEDSSRELGVLRTQVQELVTFFKDILSEVDLAVQEDVEKAFLRPIENKMTYNRDKVCQGVKMGPKIKLKVHNSAIKIQGSFCAIGDITGVYVLASDRYIIPAINRMGALADAKDEDLPAQKEDFTSWCRQSMEEIQVLTKAADAEMLPHMTERLQHLQLAIRPAH
ncbi:hypothetical protein GGTG_13404 [Gaeumannomyces tritici R3-111a-1]|uniref:Uncharacterized protein n=1 Tax=Gaeumannomyces tritici (strain R3-111a-1) TaxID=644352 RepID=J3PIS5_GAET3|nr:hypothetical protein GGTG_13404 [Gaeumannomyces tritici R3-111a-1]EJT69007.1 hypothetical protein GGTG_13404 [Gaeumannomyces tritici R3-111a-1]